MELADELREQGRGMAGALLVLGVSFAYTVETWWLAADIPATQLLGFVVGGLGLVFAVTRSVGFRSDDAAESGTGTGRRPEPASLVVEFTEVLFQSLVIAYAMLFLLGIVGLRTPISVIVRSGLVQLVPLAVGAALANQLLSGDQDELPEAGFPRTLGVFALGAIFFAAPIAPTGEVNIIATRLSWGRLCALILVTVAVTYLMLYQLDFRGQTRRLEDRSPLRQGGQTCIVYVVALLVAFTLLAALANIGTEPVATWVRRTVVLAFPAAIGASGARVVLG